MGSMSLKWNRLSDVPYITVRLIGRAYSEVREPAESVICYVLVHGSDSGAYRFSESLSWASGSNYILRVHLSF